jgi:hypothetical protein
MATNKASHFGGDMGEKKKAVKGGKMPFKKASAKKPGKKMDAEDHKFGVR